MKAIIFGSNGQDGYYLNQFLLDQCIEVYNISRSNSLFNGDIADSHFVKKILDKIRPDFVFSFAANSTTKHEAVFEHHNTIGLGTLNILESVKELSLKCKIFLSGSGLQFQNQGQPINENTPFDASSTYSLARIYSIYAARYYRDKFSLPVYVGYFFNHDSPIRTERHINKQIVVRAKEIANGSQEKLIIGNLSVRKEFSFAGDIIKGVWTLVNQNSEFEAVIGSGKDYSIQDWVKICFDSFDLDWKEYVIQGEQFSPDFFRLVSDPKLINKLGWETTTNINELAKMMLQ